jgi:hypothetical protein
MKSFGDPDGSVEYFDLGSSRASNAEDASSIMQTNMVIGTFIRIESLIQKCL